MVGKLKHEFILLKVMKLECYEINFPLKEKLIIISDVSNEGMPIKFLQITFLLAVIT